MGLFCFFSMCLLGSVWCGALGKSDHSKLLASLPFRSAVSQVQIKDSFVSVSQHIESTTL